MNVRIREHDKYPHILIACVSKINIKSPTTYWRRIIILGLFSFLHIFFSDFWSEQCHNLFSFISGVCLLFDLRFKEYNYSPPIWIEMISHRFRIWEIQITVKKTSNKKKEAVIHHFAEISSKHFNFTDFSERKGRYFYISFHSKYRPNTVYS